MARRSLSVYRSEAAPRQRQWAQFKGDAEPVVTALEE